MSAIPNCEAILLEIQRSLGKSRYQTVQKDRFRRHEKDFTSHNEMGREVLHDLVKALQLQKEPALIEDLAICLLQFLQFHSIVEVETRTYGADDKQIIWHLLAYYIMPGLSRQYAIWNSVESVDADMPGGALWFVPRISSKNTSRLSLPVQAITEWWLDLMSSPLETVWTDENAATRVRTLQNWRKGMLPSSETIDEYFGLEHAFDYQGAFIPSDGDPEQSRYEKARAFVLNIKRLDAAELANEIPCQTEPFFSDALSGRLDASDQKLFVDAVAKRWAKPTNSLVRRRFMVARMLQDAYARLVKLITPNIEVDCPDPQPNKALQLVQLFVAAYEVASEAESKSTSVDEANSRFSEITPRWLAEGPMKAIMTIYGNEANELSQFLTNRFRGLLNVSQVDDLFLDGFMEKGPSDFSPNETAAQARSELEELLARLRSAFEGGRRKEAKELIVVVEKHERLSEFSADILFLKGKHLLATNFIEEAEQSFISAFEACKGRNYGKMRSEIAHACFEMSMAFSSFSERAEKYFRVILHSFEPLQASELPKPDPTTSFEELFRNESIKAAEKFWSTLYRPYPGVERLAPLADDELKIMINEFMRLEDANERSIDDFVKRHRKLLNGKLRDVRGDTAFGMLVKLLNTFGSQPVPNVKNIILNQQRALHKIAERMSWKSLENRDFKGQTALILAADANDIDLVQILLSKGVDIDAQCFDGRNALHAAAALRATECYIQILNKGADPTKKTIDGASALHTATRFGVVEAVKETLTKYPDRFNAEDKAELSEIVSDIYSHYKQRRREFAIHDRKIGPKHSYKVISELLETSL